MYYPQIDDNNNSRSMTNTFLGYDHNPVINAGEFYDMANLTSDNYPLMSARPRRKIMLSLGNENLHNRDITVRRTYMFDGSLTYTAMYMMDCENDLDETVYQVSYVVDTSVIGSAAVHVIAFAEDGRTLAENDFPADLSSSEQEQSFSVPVRTKKFAVSITTKSISPNTYDPNEITAYVHDIALKEAVDNVRGILLKNGQIAYMSGQRLFYKGESYDFSADVPEDDDGYSDQQLISFGAYILVFPAGIYLNTVNPSDRGSMSAEMSLTDGSVTCVPSDYAGSEIKATVSDTAPEDPKNGEYWFNTVTEGLYRYRDYTKMWIPIATNYVKFTFPKDTDMSEFAEGDAINLRGGGIETRMSDISSNAIIQKMDIDENECPYIVVYGNIRASYDFKATQEAPITLSREVPELDYVCVSNNRVWGCKYGETEDGFVNEIYASKLGSFKNFRVYAGNSQDSYSVSIADDGPFTGAITYQGTPTFFKEQKIFKIYGAYPAAYQLYTYDCRGVQEGSARSLAIVGSYLLYKSVADVCVFDGSTATGISQALGNESYTQAAAGSALNKYYISLRGEDDLWHLFVYDMTRSVWMKEDTLKISEFAYSNNGQLYGQSGYKIYGFAAAKDNISLKAEDAEEYVTWFAETGDLGYETPDQKYVNRITVRASVPYMSEITLQVSCDDGPYETQGVIRGQKNPKTQSFSVAPQRCDHYRLRFEGHGDCRIYSIATTFEEGSEETWR